MNRYRNYITFFIGQESTLSSKIMIPMKYHDVLYINLLLQRCIFKKMKKILNKESTILEIHRCVNIFVVYYDILLCTKVYIYIYFSLKTKFHFSHLLSKYFYFYI